MERPAFADPGQPVPPLGALVPAPPAQRDPNVPFDVAASLMTAETSAWASSHFPGPGRADRDRQHPPTTAPCIRPRPTPGPSTGPTSGVAPPTSQAVVNGQAHRAAHERPPTTGAGSDRPPAANPPGYPPPAGAVYPAPLSAPTYPPPGNLPPATRRSRTRRPGQPFPPPGWPANGPFAAPGTPQWFGPGDYQQPPSPTPGADRAHGARRGHPGLLLTLVVGGFIWMLAPVTIVVAFVLSGRMLYGRKVTRTAFAAVLAFLGLVGLLSLITADGSFSAVVGHGRRLGLLRQLGDGPGQHDRGLPRAEAGPARPTSVAPAPSIR